MRHKAQALLTVLFLMVLAGTLIVGLAGMWQADIRARSLEKDGIAAFYLAQAGLERAKVELKNNWDWAGVLPVSFGGGNYTVAVSSPDVNTRSVASYGRKGSCLRAIGASIVRSGAPPVIYAQLNWQEI